jgi:hypothetical protein
MPGYSVAMKNIIAIVLFAAMLHAQSLHQPFLPGISMCNQGTVFSDKSGGGLEAWTPAAYSSNSVKWALSFATVNFYDPMDNLDGSYIYQVSSGVFLRIASMQVKFSASLLNAVSTYFEQSLYVSAGYSVSKRARLSIECRGYRYGIYNWRDDRRYVAETGCTGLLNFQKISATVQLEHIVLYGDKKSKENNPEFSISGGIHTKRNRFGAQGFILSYTPASAKPLQYRIGEEVFIFDWLGIHVALANNPLLVSFGLSVDFINPVAAFAMVNHEKLGWSEGVYLGLRGD